ncbi:MAG: hypothetical protein ABI670_17600 [Chloroflexota bacterium]
MATETQIAFEGTKDEQELATRAFDAIKRKHIMHGVNVPIKMTLTAIVEALTKAGGPMAGTKPADVTPKLEAALRKNSAVFAAGQNGEYVTTKAGRAPNIGQTENTHTFKERLNTEAKPLDPEEAKEYQSSLVNRTTTRAERNAAILESVVEAPVPAPIRPYVPPISTPYSRSTEIPTLIPQAHIVKEREPEEVQAAPVPATPAPPVEPAAQATPATPVTRTPATAAGATQSATAAPATPTVPATPIAPPTTPSTQAAPTTVTQTPAVAVPPTPQAKPATAPEAGAAVRPTEAATPQAQTQPRTAPPASTGEAQTATAKPATPSAPVETSTQAPVEQAKPVVAPPAPAKPAAPAAPPTPVVTGPIEVAIPSENGPITIDLTQPVDEILLDDAAAAALEKLVSDAVTANDTRLIRFGSDIFAEEATERFSKGDYRRIKEYLEEPETGGVASDRDIMADVLGRRTDHPDYDRLRFSLNYRMLKEKKDFEFVGIDSDRLWINTGTSPVLPTTRKPAEIGQDYRFLEDPAIASVEEEEEAARDYKGGPIDYSLTYYEYENGVLPYDRRFKRVYPGAVFEDQRSSLLRFEIPQLYGSLLAELRYPTGNRGGFLMGLSELFTVHMVPGAKFTITPTDRGEDVFEIHFTRAEEQEENLLQLDERKGRYVFRPVSYAVATDPAMLLTQGKFGKMHNQKKLEDSERRRPDFIIANAFEAVGENNDGKLWAIFDDIYPIVNIERPISPSWLRTMLSGAYPFFYPDETTEGAYFYDASKRPS